MKKLLTLIIALALILPAAASASIPDISDLTEVELHELQRQIQLKLFSDKLVDGVKVSPGVYVVGKDIPEGEYRIEYQTEDKHALATFSAYREEPFFSFSSVLGYSGPYEIGKIELTAGITVRIESDSLYFFGYSGMFN